MVDATQQPRDETRAAESRRERLGRHGHRTLLYVWACLLIALLVVLVALVGRNTRQVKLDWIIGSGQASLVWIVLGAALIGWLLGIVTSVLFRRRTRRAV